MVRRCLRPPLLLSTPAPCVVKKRRFRVYLKSGELRRRTNPRPIPSKYAHAQAGEPFTWCGRIFKINPPYGKSPSYPVCCARYGAHLSWWPPWWGYSSKKRGGEIPHVPILANVYRACCRACQISPGHQFRKKHHNPTPPHPPAHRLFWSVANRHCAIFKSF